jgi:hypothetical protein
VSPEPIPAVRVKPGEYFLAAETVHVGDRFAYEDSLYEVVGKPLRVGPGWMALVRVVEGLRPGSEFNAMLRTGRRVDG